MAQEELAQGARLPTEQRLTELLGVSRSTVREALRTLEREGVVASRQGSGTFVVGAERSLRTDLGTLRSTTALIRAGGYTPGSRLLRVDVRPAPAWVADRLCLPVGSTTVYLERVRTADGEPLCLVHDELPGEPTLAERYRAEAPDSLLDFLARATGQRIARSACEIRAAGATARAAASLAVRRGSPLLQLDQQHLTPQGQVAFFSRSFWRTDGFAFHLLRHAEHAA